MNAKESEPEEQDLAQREREEYERFGRRVADSRLYRWAGIYADSQGALLLGIKVTVYLIPLGIKVTV